MNSLEHRRHPCSRPSLKKCASRHIEPAADSLEDPEVKERSGTDWNSLALELGEIPDFERCFNCVRIFYRTLPLVKSRVVSSFNTLDGRDVNGLKMTCKFPNTPRAPSCLLPLQLPRAGKE